MIPGTPALKHPSDWQSELARAVTDPAELISLLNLDPGLLPAAQAAARLFPLRAPRGFIARMRQADPNDPLLRQVLPLGAERESVAGFTGDPVGDLAAMVVPGVLHKYQGRVLLTVTGACAVHCRYCFRRHFPYDEANPVVDKWRQTLDYIAGDDSITEVILSGGDPLSMSDRRLADLARSLDAIPHLRRLRLHTRLPIVLPERVNDELLDWLGATRLKTIVVVHANHANEIDASVITALAGLKMSGAQLLNQSVLLRGVNDNSEALVALSEKLFEAGVLPYYLHLLDRVHGAAHFEVKDAAARYLMAELNRQLPGYLVPRLVREIPGQPGKVSAI